MTSVYYGGFFSLFAALARVFTEATLPPNYPLVEALQAAAAPVELPMPEQDTSGFTESLVVHVSAFYHKKIVNRYSGSAPPGYRIIREAMQSFLRSSAAIRAATGPSPR